MAREFRNRSPVITKAMWKPWGESSESGIGGNVEWGQGREPSSGWVFTDSGQRTTRHPQQGIHATGGVGWFVFVGIDQYHP